jgi:hypothetical protein
MDTDYYRIAFSWEFGLGVGQMLMLSSIIQHQYGKIAPGFEIQNNELVLYLEKEPVGVWDECMEAFLNGLAVMCSVDWKFLNDERGKR